jgi:hypothetical protein
MDIERIIELVVANTRQSLWDDAAGFAQNLEADLLDDDVFADAELTHTENQLSRIELVLTCGPKALYLQNVLTGMRVGYMRSAYTELQASSLRYDRNAATLRFVTAIPDNNLRVTGTIVVRDDAYRRLFIHATR